MRWYIHCREELCIHLLECYFVVHIPHCFANRAINTRRTLEWALWLFAIPYRTLFFNQVRIVIAPNRFKQNRHNDNQAISWTNDNFEWYFPDETKIFKTIGDSQNITALKWLQCCCRCPHPALVSSVRCRCPVNPGVLCRLTCEIGCWSPINRGRHANRTSQDSCQHSQVNQGLLQYTDVVV